MAESSDVLTPHCRFSRGRHQGGLFHLAASKIAAAWLSAFDELLKERPENRHQVFGLGSHQSREADHLPHDLNAEDEGEHESSALGREVSAQSGRHGLVMTFLDLRAADFGGALARCGTKHNQEAVERCRPYLR